MTMQNLWSDICAVNDLVAGSGVCAMVGDCQVAIFYLPDEQPAVYAIDNFDPLGGANVLSRGIVGDIGGELVVASPLYKEHFSLIRGECLEKLACVRVWPVRVMGDMVQISSPVALESVA